MFCGKCGNKIRLGNLYCTRCGERAEFNILDNCHNETENGNSIGNIFNNGVAAYKEGWIFYSNYDDMGSLYKVKTDGTEKVKLNNDSSFQINIIGSQVVYENNSDDGRIYKIRTDGTGRTRICSDSDCNNVIVVGEWIYYKKGVYLMKIRVDGTDRTELARLACRYMNVVADKIYFVDESDCYYIEESYDEEEDVYYEHYNYLKEMNVDGSGIKRTGCILESERFFVIGNWVYYMYDTSICKSHLDGSHKEVLVSGYCPYMNIDNGYIYYRNHNDNNNIYKIYNDGTQNTKLTNCNDNKDHNLINIVGDWIYFSLWRRWYDDENSYHYENLGWYKIRTDGTGYRRVK